MAVEKDYLNRLTGGIDDFITGIPEEEQVKLHKLIKSVSVKKDDYFLKAGEIPNRIGFVVSGLLRLFYIDSSGMEINKYFCLENSLAISYSAFLLREESKLYIQALEDSDLYVIDYKAYNQLIKSHHCWEIAARKLAEMLFIIKEKKEAALLLNSAQERYLTFLKDYPHLEKRINQYHIASYLGITPESLSRIRSNLRQK
ncbi:MAG: Crp/Fnr family transcriptional regulator [Syntrophomonas sp.]